MTEIADIFAELGISHYLHDFIEQGFDTWDTILDITESDFDALGVKLGHRRKLQRKIANSRGLSSDRALQSPRHTPSDDRQPEEPKSGGPKVENKDGTGAPTAKRKYRRHPKPDENAPERPPSAYVIFSNKMREELKGRNLSFTEIAKLVGENWQNLSPGDKEPFEQQAFAAKEKYHNELLEYKKTDNFRDYSLYLAEFKMRQSNQQHAVTDAEVAKRPKLEAHMSTTSTESSSGASLHGTRVDSAPSHSSSPWQASDPTQSPHPYLPKMSPAFSNGMNGPSPPLLTHSPPVLPGYRESIFPGPSHGSHPANHQALAWRENQREECIEFHLLPRISSADDRRPGPDPLNLTGSVQHAHRTGQGHPPPLLTSESTNRSAGSTASTSSSYFAPRTPIEPSLDRALPIPTPYNQKPSSHFENYLPPLRQASLSPRLVALGVQQTPNGAIPISDLPPNAMRTFSAGPSPILHNEQSGSRMREYMSASSSEDNSVALDPVSALLKAGEIVNRSSENSRNLSSGS